jgi:hypothetical protein
MSTETPCTLCTNGSKAHLRYEFTGSPKKLALRQPALQAAKESDNFPEMHRAGVRDQYGGDIKC